jgi:uncharacterized membrane protein YgdD (TMEM256/DUF423 family)
MIKRNNIEKAVDDATEHVVAAADDLKAGATAMVEGLGRTTEKKLRNVRTATETAWDEAGSTAKNLHSKGVLYVRIHPRETLVLIFGAILSVGFVFFLLRIMRKYSEQTKSANLAADL